MVWRAGIRANRWWMGWGAAGFVGGESQQAADGRAAPELSAQVGAGVQVSPRPRACLAAAYLLHSFPFPSWCATMGHGASAHHTVERKWRVVLGEASSVFKVTTGACALRSACPDPGALEFKVKRLFQNVCAARCNACAALGR